MCKFKEVRALSHEGKKIPTIAEISCNKDERTPRRGVP
jgi:hypothetical protein